MKFEDDRQRSSNLHMSSGDSFVLEPRVESAVSLVLMTSMQFLIGTDGNRASALNDIMRSSGPRVRVLM
jgi:urease beta subunit